MWVIWWWWPLLLFALVYGEYFYSVSAFSANLVWFDIMGMQNSFLTNTLNYVHPPFFFGAMLWIAYGYKVYFVLNPRYNFGFWNTLRRFSYWGTWLIGFFLMVLGGWWAYQEGNWGGWWNWDPSELISLFLLMMVMRIIHGPRTMIRFRSASSLWLFFIYFIIVQLSFTDVSHNFGIRLFMLFSGKGILLMFEVFSIVFWLRTLRLFLFFIRRYHWYSWRGDYGKIPREMFEFLIVTLLLLYSMAPIYESGVGAYFLIFIESLFNVCRWVSLILFSLIFGVISINIYMVLFGPLYSFIWALISSQRGYLKVEVLHFLLLMVIFGILENNWAALARGGDLLMRPWLVSYARVIQGGEIIMYFYDSISGNLLPLAIAISYILIKRSRG